MSSFLSAVNCLPQAWLLVGQAVRSAQDLGLHVSHPGYILTRRLELIATLAIATTTIYSSDREGDEEEGLVGGVHP